MQRKLTVDELLEWKNALNDPDTWTKNVLTDNQGKYCAYGHLYKLQGCEVVVGQPMPNCPGKLRVMMAAIWLDDKVHAFTDGNCDGLAELNDEDGREAVVNFIDDLIREEKALNDQ